MALAWLSSSFAEELDTAIRDAKRDLILCAGLRTPKASLHKEAQQDNYRLVERAPHRDSTQYSPRASLPAMTSLRELNDIFDFQCKGNQPCVTFGRLGSFHYEKEYELDKESQAAVDTVHDCCHGLPTSDGDYDLKNRDHQEVCDVAEFAEVSFPPVDEQVISQDAAAFQMSTLKPKLTINLSRCLLQVASVDTPRENLSGEISPIHLDRQNCLKQRKLILRSAQIAPRL
jgi:hypothetical protein